MVPTMRTIADALAAVDGDWRRQAAFDYFNEVLFRGALPEMRVTFLEKSWMKGFYCPAAWYGDEEEDIDELSMNPDVLQLAPRDALSVMVHKMCHYWQFGYGSPSWTTRHDEEWAQKMAEIGLLSCSASQPGITLAGQRVGHVIVPRGAFSRAFDDAPRQVLLPWTSLNSVGEAVAPLTQVSTTMGGR